MRQVVHHVPDSHLNAYIRFRLALTEDMPTIKPIDREAILAAATRSRLLLTVEEHNVIGGLGGAVAEVLADAGVPARLVRHGIVDEYSLIAPPTHLYRHYRLDAAGIESVAREVLG